MIPHSSVLETRPKVALINGGRDFESSGLSCALKQEASQLQTAEAG